MGEGEASPWLSDRKPVEYAPFFTRCKICKGKSKKKQNKTTKQQKQKGKEEANRPSASISEFAFISSDTVC